MEQWFKSQYDVFYYRNKSLKITSTLKTLFYSNNSDLRNGLIEDSHVVVSSSDNRKTSDNASGKKKKTGEGGKEETIWRRMSWQSYRKRKQKREEEKTKPVIAAVLRTYDKRPVVTRENSLWL
ncbi:unnamed protein product [Phyllotreta striolata]|uniref:Uncharacterized protein n=1 Tax=Phyllotreta striolata TaxID=444603 RepID=A0A9N9TQU9_PHYSR|nr:unnamed protein product [Phyllotreta striolata]